MHLESPFDPCGEPERERGPALALLAALALLFAVSNAALAQTTVTQSGGGATWSLVGETSLTTGQTYTYTLTLTGGTKPQNEHFGLTSSTLGLNRFKRGIDTCSGGYYFCYAMRNASTHQEFTVNNVNFSGHVLGSGSPYEMTLVVALGTPVGTQVNLGVVDRHGIPRADAMQLTVTEAADTTAPRVSDATVDGASLVITFNEDLATAANLANSAFTVKKTSSRGEETTVTLAGSPSISGATVTLTLTAAVVSSHAVTVSYAKPTSGMDNALADAAGNQVARFRNRAVTNNTPNNPPMAADSTVTTDEDTAYTFAASDFNFADTDTGDALASVTITTLESAGDLELDGTDVTLNQAVATTDIDASKLRFTPAENANGSAYATFRFTVSDGADDSASSYTMTIDVTAVNDPPTVANAIPDQTATEGAAFSFQFAANTFDDVDDNTLTYTAVEDGESALPSWLSFDAGTRTFSGTPAAADAGTVTVRVTASDGGGASASDAFDITVTAQTMLPVLTVANARALEGDAVAFTVTLSGAASDDVTVQYDTSSSTLEAGTATADEDYEANSGTLVIPAGETGGGVVVATLEDARSEDDERFTLTLSNPSSNAELGAPASATGTILDDDRTDAGVALPAPTGAVALVGADLGEEVRDASVDLCWDQPGIAVPADAVIEMRSRRFWDYSEEFLPWRRMAAGDGYAACGTGGVQVTHDRRWRGLAFTLEVRIRRGGTVLAISPQLRAQVPNHDTAELHVHLSEPLDEDGRGIDDPDGPFYLELSFTDPTLHWYTTEAVRGLEASDFQVMNGEVTSVEVWNGMTYKVKVEPDMPGQDVAVTLPAGAVRGVCEALAPDGDNTYSCGRTNKASNTTTAATRTVGAPLRAAFEDVPESHDGSTAFSFRLAFTDAVAAEPEAMRDHALTVTGGTATAATREDGRGDLWAFTVAPAGDDSVGITVPANRPCGEPGALCTGDGRRLSGELTRKIPYAAPVSGTWGRDAALTAAFENTPSSHDGSSAFALELAFSEAVFEGDEPFDQSRAIRNALRVTGGAVVDSRRVDDARFDRWIVHIRPSGYGDVTVVLPKTAGNCGAAGAVCTPDGRPLSGEARAVVQGPPALSVADAEAPEGPGAALAFTVTLSRAAPGPVTVEYATEDGTARAGEDYAATDGVLAFAAGETARTVSVPVLEDSHDDTGETLTFRLSSPSGAYLADGAATGTILNSGPLPGAWLSRFGRAAADGALEAIGRRFAEEDRQTHLTLGGGGFGRLRMLLGDARGDGAEGHGPAGGGDGQRPEGRAGEPAPHGPMEPAGQDGTAPGRMGGMNGGGGPDMGSSGTNMGGGTGMGPGGMNGGGSGMGAPCGAGRSGGGADALLRFMGVPHLRDLLRDVSFIYRPGEAVRQRTPDWLGDWTAWGETAASGFRGSEDRLRIDGELFTATAGFDTRRGNWMGGLALSHARGEGGYAGAGGGGDITSALTTLYPYARYRFNERASAWAALGYGMGSLSLTPEGAESGALKAGLGHLSAAVGGRAALSVRAGERGGFELALRSDARWNRTESEAVTGLMGASGETSRARLLLEGAGSLQVPGGVLSPTLEAGLRYDAGDAETGAGLEVGGGLAYRAGRLTVQLNGRGLAAHQHRDYSEWGYSASVSYQPGQAGLGPRFAIGSTVGAAQSGVQKLWGSEAAADLGRGGAAGGQRLQAEFGWGFAGRGQRRWTPALGFQGTGKDDASMRLGLNLTAGERFNLDLEFGLRQAAGGEGGGAARLQFSYTW